MSTAQAHARTHTKHSNAEPSSTNNNNGSPSSAEEATTTTSSTVKARRDLPKKRNRAALSCVACRERKIKCDRQLPCDQCIKRGDDDLCFLDPYKRGPPAAQSKSAKVQAQLQEQARQQAQREMQKAAGLAAPASQFPQQQYHRSGGLDSASQVDLHHHQQQLHPQHTQHHYDHVRQTIPYATSQTTHLHSSYANHRPMPSSSTTQTPSVVTPHTAATATRHSESEVEVIKSRLAQLEAVLGASGPGRNPGGQNQFSPGIANSSSNDSTSYRHSNGGVPPSALPPLAGMLGGSSSASHTLGGPWHPSGDENTRLAPLRSSTRFSTTADSPSSQASSSHGGTPLYAYPRYQKGFEEQDQPSPHKNPRLSSPRSPSSFHREARQPSGVAKSDLDSDTEDAAMVLEGLAMSGKNLRPDEKAACPVAELNVDPVIKEPQETLTAYVARNRERDIMLDVSQGGTSGPAADQVAAPAECATTACDSNGPDSLQAVAKLEEKGIDVSPARKVCLALKGSTSLFRPIFGPESFLGFGMGWAFPAAEAANDLHVKGGQCPGSAQREAVLRAIIRALPRRQLAAQLVSVYADRVNFLAGNIIHMPSFRRDVEAFYALETVEKQARVVNNIDAGWLAVYLLVIVLALRFYPCTPPEDWESITHLFDGRSIHLYGSAARTTLGLARYQSSRSLAVLQAILLFNLSDSHSGRSNPTMLRVAISNAQEMGLHRLGDASRRPKLGDSTSLVIRRELAKRIWYQLVFKDWTASGGSHIYAIHSGQFNTPLPGNYNDEDLETVPLPAPKGRGEYSEMSYTIESYAVVKVMKLRTDLINEVKISGGEEEAKHAMCPQAAIIDRAFRNVLEDLPSFFAVGSEVGANTNVEIQRWLLQQGVFHYLLKLHRPALASRPEARLSCVVLARSILDTQKKLRSRCTVVDRLIGNLAQSYTAAIVLLLDLLQPQEGEIAGEAARREVIRSEVAEALRALHHVNETTNASEGAIKVIEALLAEEQIRWANKQAEKMKPVGLKRQRINEQGQPKKKDLLRLALGIARATQGTVDLTTPPILEDDEDGTRSQPFASQPDSNGVNVNASHDVAAQREADKDTISRALMEQLLVPQAPSMRKSYNVNHLASGAFDSLSSSGAFDSVWNTSTVNALGSSHLSGEDSDGQFLAGHEDQDFDLNTFLAAYNSPGGQSSSNDSNPRRDSSSIYSLDDSCTSTQNGGTGNPSSCDTSVYGCDNNGNEGGLSSKTGYFSPPNKGGMGAVSTDSHVTNDSAAFAHNNGNNGDVAHRQSINGGHIHQTTATSAPSPLAPAAGQQHSLDAFYNWVLSQALNGKTAGPATPSIPQQFPAQSQAHGNGGFTGDASVSTGQGQGARLSSMPTSSTQIAPSAMQQLVGTSGGSTGGSKTAVTPLPASSMGSFWLSHGDSAASSAGGGGAVAAGGCGTANYIDFLAPFGGPPQDSWPSSAPSSSGDNRGGAGHTSTLEAGSNSWGLRSMTPQRPSSGQSNALAASASGSGSVLNLGTPSAVLTGGGAESISGAGTWLSGPGLFDFGS